MAETLQLAAATAPHNASLFVESSLLDSYLPGDPRKVLFEIISPALSVVVRDQDVIQ